MTGNPTRSDRTFLKANRATIEKTVDGEYMLLIDGLQWGGKRDLSGAGDATFPTPKAAVEALRAALGDS